MFLVNTPAATDGFAVDEGQILVTVFLETAVNPGGHNAGCGSYALFQSS